MINPAFVNSFLLAVLKSHQRISSTSLKELTRIQKKVTVSATSDLIIPQQQTQIAKDVSVKGEQPSKRKCGFEGFEVRGKEASEGNMPAMSHAFDIFRGMLT